MLLAHILRHKKRYGILLVLLIIASYFLWPKGSKPVDTTPVKRQDIVQSLSETGTVDSTNMVNLSFLISGKLTYLGAAKGDFVKQGETIAIVDQRSLQKNLETALRSYSE